MNGTSFQEILGPADRVESFLSRQTPRRQKGSEDDMVRAKIAQCDSPMGRGDDKVSANHPPDEASSCFTIVYTPG